MIELENAVFNIKNNKEFEAVALSVFQYQASANPVYKDYLAQLKVQVSAVNQLADIPFLPIEFFKTFRITCATSHEEAFTSSGTTGSVPSKHWVHKRALYEQSFLRAFEHFYGHPKDYTVLALLPGYLERTGSSLVYMVNKLIAVSDDDDSGFFLHNHQDLLHIIKRKEAAKKKYLLIGVSFALLDLIEQHQVQLTNGLVMETGGMKGRRKEVTREELHASLCAGLGVSEIHSEYGMTELLSQAYSMGDFRFRTPPWMRVTIRDVYDPFGQVPQGRTGGINVIDLANLHSCSFIETKDLGKLHADESFEVLGRFDHADIRGCNLMVE